MTTASRSGGPATLKFYDAVSGFRENQVRKFSVGEVGSYAQHDRSVAVVFTEPRKRSSKYMRIVPDNISFVTIDVGGETVYDSRVDVPCDMDHWHETNARFKGDRPFQTRVWRDGVLVSDSADEPEVQPPPYPDAGELQLVDDDRLF
jgi:hypothetical protein